jgi:hypothetical protein
MHSEEGALARGDRTLITDSNFGVIAGRAARPRLKGRCLGNDPRAKECELS